MVNKAASLAKAAAAGAKGTPKAHDGARSAGAPQLLTTPKAYNGDADVVAPKSEKKEKKAKKDKGDAGDEEAPPTPGPVVKVKVPVPAVPTFTPVDPLFQVSAVPPIETVSPEPSRTVNPLAVEKMHAFCEHDDGAVPVTSPMTFVPFATAAFVVPTAMLVPLRKSDSPLFRRSVSKPFGRKRTYPLFAAVPGALSEMFPPADDPPAPA